MKKIALICFCISTVATLLIWLLAFGVFNAEDIYMASIAPAIISFVFPFAYTWFAGGKQEGTNLHKAILTPEQKVLLMVAGAAFPFLLAAAYSAIL